jgi:hypothetical protein
VVARGKLREAENELRETEDRLEERLREIPPSEDVAIAWTLRFCAEKLANRRVLEQRLEKVEEKISDLEAIKTFRSKKAGDRPEVAAATAERDRLLEEIREINGELAESKVTVDRYDQMEAEAAEAAAWAAAGYRGEMPKGVQRVEAAHWALVEAGLEVLPPIRKVRV